MIYIIGSGPSGVAAAVALVKRGLRPTILDAGVEADLSVTALKARLASVEPEDWTSEDLAGIKEMGPDGRSGIPRKLHLGSDFPYRDVDHRSAADAEHVTMLRSFARGGLSNVWGGVMQPLSSADFLSWPIGVGELAPHYAEVRKMMDLVLDENVRVSAQSQAFYDDLERHQKDLDRQGIHFDYARLAVRTTDVGDKKGCRYCGLCLYGCPYDAIFNAANVLRSLVLQGNVSYVSGVIVDRIALMNGRLRIEARSTTGDGVRTFEAGRVFLAAGVLETARIALNSTNLKSAILARQSDIFTLPMLRYRSSGQIDRERISTLSQIVLRVEDEDVCTHPVHLQLYGYNDLYMSILQRRFGRIGVPMTRILDCAVQRLFVAFGYLHSEVSSAIRIIRLANSVGSLRLESVVNIESHHVGRAVARKLLRNRKYFHALPLWFDVRFGEPGAGHRIGGSFPMRRTPKLHETNQWGVLPDLQGVHLVDASVLSSISAAPIAFTAMANAHRIGSECPLTDAV
jgi:ferredoxin